jgi:uncharacterized protein (TIGR02145 family)
MKKNLIGSLRAFASAAICIFLLDSCENQDDGILEETIIESEIGETISFGGHQYATIVLGNEQQWMAENLKTPVYANGDSIPNIISNSSWSSLQFGAWVYYDNDSANNEVSGKLYNWYAVNDNRNICPDGWRVASDSDWSNLINYLDPNAEGGSVMPNAAAVKMKIDGIEGWSALHQDGVANESGFTAVPSGNRYYNGLFGGNDDIAYWWSSTETTENDGAWFRVIASHEFGILKSFQNKKAGMCVRCIKD